MNSVRLAKVELGSSVGVIGLGLLGQFATMFSKLCGAFPLIAVDLSDFRLSLAIKSGVHYVINPSKEKLHGAVESLTKKRMLDIVFEVIGNPEVNYQLMFVV